MRPTNGRILMILGMAHAALAVSALAFGEQFAVFADTFFFKVSEGLLEFPLLDGVMDYQGFAAFWFFYFGLLLIPLGLLVGHIEMTQGAIPRSFKATYLIIVLLGVYMIPLSGMTFLMLPHAVYMLFNKESGRGVSDKFS